MINSTLAFPDEKSLNDFKATLQCNILDMSSTAFTLTTNCHRKDMDRAIGSFGAKLINNPALVAEKK
jgi:hypothetical protein